MKVTVTLRHYIDIIGSKFNAGDEIDLPIEIVEKVNKQHPGLLIETRENMQKTVQAVQNKGAKRGRKRKQSK